MRIGGVLLLAWVASWSRVADADGDGDIPVPKDLQPDFYVIYDQCKVMGAPMRHVDAKLDSVRVTPLPSKGLACERSKKKSVVCVETDEGAAPVAYELSSVLETTEDQIYATPRLGVVIQVSLKEHVAVLDKRLMTTTAVAVKICHGDFLTADEANAVLSAKPKK